MDDSNKVASQGSSLGLHVNAPRLDQHGPRASLRAHVAAEITTSSSNEVQEVHNRQQSYVAVAMHM